MIACVRKVLDFVFPVKCVGCGKPDVLVCDGCVSGVRLLDSQVCPHCRRASPRGSFCGGQCRDGLFGYPSSFDHLVVCSRYDKTGVLKKIIERFKYKYSEELTDVLGHFYVEQVEILNKFFEQDFDGAVMVPVPLHSKRFRERGFNQAYLLAKEIEFDWELRSVLIRVKNTPHQARLDRAGRLRNLNNAFSIKHNSRIEGRNIVLIDDVCTTGATLNECAKVLKKAGAGKVLGFVLARG
ncbi:ComF family protein [Candidatus Peregrinibacteria bacterium]|jgi:competence protein ComFC|nr:ComF family protein [Candidatus Peregrinibacteria bacterium]